MPRYNRPNFRPRRAVPEVDYYAGEVGTEEVVTRRTTTTVAEVDDPNDGRALAWALLTGLAVLIALGAYLVGRDDADDAAPAPTPSPSSVVTSVIVVPGQAPPAPPPVIVQQPPPVIIQQPPAATASPAQPTSSP